MNDETNRRILLIDDSPAIHEDFRKILATEEAGHSALDEARAAFLGSQSAATSPARAATVFELDSAMQGDEGYGMVRAARKQGRPYALAFVDVRMPPGWDGIETIAKLWEVDHELQVVICTAYSDYSWEETFQKLGRVDRLLILKKPFDPIEISQLATALTEKWNVARRVACLIEELRGKEQEARSYASSLETLNRALSTSKAAAERAAEMKSEFLVHLSSEISGKVGAVLGQVEALRRPASGDRVPLDQLESVCESSRYLISTLDDILDITRLETGQMELELDGFSPLQLAQDVVEEFRERATAKGLELALETVGPINESLCTDQRRVRQILWNLLDNAVKYTDAGSVRLVVGMDLTDSWESSLFRFEVRDTGCGIPPGISGGLFEPFQSCDPSPDGSSGGVPGAGVGLAFARRVARMLDGDLSVESTQGEGSVFTLTISSRSTLQSGRDAA